MSIEKEVLNKALKLLEASSKSRMELDRKLKERGFSGDAVGKALDKLEALGFLNDRQLAMNLISRYTGTQPAGRHKIAYELKRRGIPPLICREVLAELGGDEEILRALDSARRRSQRLANEAPEVRRKKIIEYLIRRGFDFEVAREAARDVFSGAQGMDEIPAGGSES